MKKEFRKEFFLIDFLKVLHEYLSLGNNYEHAGKTVCTVVIQKHVKHDYSN